MLMPGGRIKPRNAVKIILIGWILSLIIGLVHHDGASISNINPRDDERVDLRRYNTLTLSDMIGGYLIDDTVIVDTRSRSEFDFRHILGAINISPSELDAIPEDKLRKLRSAESVYLYCNRHCSNSSSAAAALFAHGFENIGVFHAGFVEWDECRLPVDGKTKIGGLSFQLVTKSEESPQE